MPGEIADLIERLEAASGGSKELDCRIHAAIRPDYRIMIDAGSVRPPVRPASWGPLADLSLDGWLDYEALARVIGASAYTTSLDAAITLLPEGFAIRDWMIWPGVPSELTIYGTTQFRKGHEYWHRAEDGRWSAKASTPALALCIAALKAIAAHPTPSIEDTPSG